VSNVWARFRDVLAKLLDPAEREAVFGDFAELALTDRHAVKSLAGLLVRRQLRFWTEWNPWFVLVAVIIPICPLLARLCSELGMETWPSVVMWLHHGPTYDTGLRPTAFVSELCFQAAALITWSWTCGLALGALSRRTIWLSGALFFGLYVFVLSSDGVFSAALRWAWLPFSINFLLVLFPAYFGIRQSSKLLNIEFPRLVLLGLWTITTNVLALWTQGWGQAAVNNWSRGGSALTLLQLAQDAEAWNIGINQVLAIAVLTSPVIYVFAQTALFRRPSKT
jgi:hypothetical protein